MTETERIEAVRQNGRHLFTFKEVNRTYPVCLAAVSNDGTAIYGVPQQYRTHEMYLAACKNHGGLLGVVPEEMKDYELCMAAVSSEGNALQYVPEALRSREIDEAAIYSNAPSFSYVPQKYITPVDLDCIEHYVFEQSGLLKVKLLAALLSTASEIVNTVGKQFAQPLKVRDSKGLYKDSLQIMLLMKHGFLR